MSREQQPREPKDRPRRPSAAEVLREAFERDRGLDRVLLVGGPCDGREVPATKTAEVILQTRKGAHVYERAPGSTAALFVRTIDVKREEPAWRRS